MFEKKTDPCSGHTGIILRINGTLHVCESIGTANAPDTRVGVLATPYQTWAKNAHKTWCPTSHCAINVAKYSTALRGKLDLEKMLVSWKQTVGHPYGHNPLLFADADSYRWRAITIFFGQ